MYAICIFQGTTDVHGSVLQGRSVGELVLALLAGLPHLASRPGGVQRGGERHQRLQLGFLRGEGGGLPRDRKSPRPPAIV